MSKPAARSASRSTVVSTLLKDSGGRRWRFAVVLLASLAVSAGQPLISELFGDRDSFDVGVTLLIMAVLLLASAQGQRRVVLPLGIAAFVGLWVAHFIGGASASWLLVAAHLLTAGLFAFVLCGILGTILMGRAAGDALVGAVCGYLLLGIIWSLLYSAVETAAPGSFLIPTQDSVDANTSANRGDLGYYSFVTLSTLGFGDVTPVTPIARTLSWLEAVAGQFYLAVLVAGLVGFRVSQSHQKAASSSAIKTPGARSEESLVDPAMRG
jgi:hypothetical protein